MTIETKDIQALVKLAMFGHLVLRAHRDPEPGDVDGATIQDLALKAGVVSSVQATQACGPDCACAHLGLLPTECYVDAPGVAGVRGRLQGLVDHGAAQAFNANSLEEAIDALSEEP